MTHRERAVAALNHESPDRVPMDLGSTRVTSIVATAYDRLKAHFGVTAPDEITDGMQQTVRVDEPILLALDTDFRPVFPNPPDRVRDERTPDGKWRDEWGVLRRKPPGGHYYDLLESPFAGDEVTEADLDRYPWPDPDDPGRTRGLRERAKRLRETTDYALVCHAPGGWVHQSTYLRGFEDWFADFALQPSFLVAIMERARDITLRMAVNVLKEVGDLVDVVATGDDVGAQNGTLVAPEDYRKVIWPLHTHQFRTLREHTDAKLFYHTCGDVYPVLRDIVDLGVQILNPVQVSAKDMGDTARLKREFGQHLSFWGGVDNARVLPRGTPEDVRAEVRRRITDLGRGGGYVLGAVHNIQPDVPVENILALYDEGRAFRLN